ncbi:hypothetical protein [Natrinema altunense]|uniref:DUF8173 domain-containing protein n=1 Tax=Natrinema altunense (strain JCM 12890 / CGMCC 1.3731 / AJ2) TaxID=1227494 RepID=L9ZTD7_NATA2|nr:hypothetical protein [Natrinema altunense]ELY89614.1 hypothetical protein C485_03930 [Natrinema altunense JCM 12890]
MIGLDGPTLAVAVIMQVDPGTEIEIGTTDGLLGGALGAALTTLVVGAILIAIAPDYTDRMMDDALADPFGVFLYGIASLLGIGLLTLLLVVTIVGIVVAIPLFLLAYLVWAIGGAIAYLAIADRLVGRDDEWLTRLLVAAAISGALAVTGVGGILAICIGAAGFGAVLRNALE